MGNENKVRDLIKSSKLKFLPQELPHDETKALIYSLEDEFARTKKNKNYLLYLTVIGFVAFLSVGSYLLTTESISRQRTTDIKITEFEDLKLRELLDTAKTQERKIKQAKKELKKLNSEMQTNIDRTKSKRRKRVIQKKYSKLIYTKELEIDQIEKEKEQYDLKLRETIRQAEEMVSNYQKLVEMKMKAQRNYYRRMIWRTVLKYNPKFSSKRLNSIIRQKPALGKDEESALNTFQEELEQENILTKAEFNKIRATLENQNLLIQRMLKIPYRYSVSPAIRHLEGNSKFLVKEYEAIWSKFVLSLQKKNEMINNYRNAFNYLSKTKPESGYIVDPVDPDNISVHINKLLKVKEGDKGLVFRADDDFIGRIEFFFVEDKIKARVMKLQKDKVIKPFDKILVKI